MGIVVRFFINGNIGDIARFEVASNIGISESECDVISSRQPDVVIGEHFVVIIRVEEIGALHFA